MTEPEIITLGCRLNSYESEIMRRHASAAGLSDSVIVNTCAVTGEAVRQARQTIRRLRRERPQTKIIVTGCAAQTEPATFAAMSEVDHVIGNTEKLEARTFQGLALNTTERIAVNDIMAVREQALHMAHGIGSRARAFVQVQNGCDHRCTFCIIPYGRGPSRSVPAGVVIEHVRSLVADGYNEVVLTGVDLTSYGADLPGTPTLGRVVKQILSLVPELKRLRLSSIDLVEADAHLLDAIANEPRLMPHLHLSMQSGSDMILKRMKRRHSRTDAIRFCAAVRALRPDVIFGADLIAGFPTETADMFQDTLSIVEECGLTYLHVFPYSPRKGTPAARMPAVPGTLIKERAAALRAKGEERLKAFLETLTDKTVEILIENGNVGRTPHFAEVDLGNTSPPVGSIAHARTKCHDGRRLVGEVAA